MGSVKETGFMEVINVGLIGAGTVGCGVIKILSDNRDIIEKKSRSRD